MYLKVLQLRVVELDMDTVHASAGACESIRHQQKPLDAQDLQLQPPSIHTPHPPIASPCVRRPRADKVLPGLTPALRFASQPNCHSPPASAAIPISPSTSHSNLNLTYANYLTNPLPLFSRHLSLLS